MCKGTDVPCQKQNLLLVLEVCQVRQVLENPLPFCWIHESSCRISFKNLQNQFQKFAEVLSFPALPFCQQSLHSFQHHPIKLTETNCFKKISVFFRKERDEKSLALPDLSSEKLNHMLMVQGSRRKHWKAISSIVEVKAASLADLLRCTQATEVETADSTGSSGTET